MIALIGTAGRDNPASMTNQLWKLMVEDARKKIPKGSDVVTGGAAWSDHLSVELFLLGHISGLRLHLPASLDRQRGRFESYGAAGRAANYYHACFERATGKASVMEIALAIREGATFTEQPYTFGLGAFFARNKLVAQDATECLAYTWGVGDQPVDGGTKNTWDQINGDRVHVPLAGLLTGGFTWNEQAMVDLIGLSMATGRLAAV